MEGWNSIDDKDKPRFVAICLAIAAVAYIGANWIATQLVAETFRYSPLLTGELFDHIYQPFAIDAWRSDPELSRAMARTLSQYAFFQWCVYALGAFSCYQVYRNMSRMTSHGTADFAKEKDIKAAGLASKETGFVVGRNPFNSKIMLHNGPEHILLVAPTRSGKGVCNMVPTGICWKHSIFFFDPKGELWNFTASWRKEHMHQRVMKFEPLCKDGSAAKWNPFAEIDFQSFEELTDVSTISEMMVKTGEGGSKDPFWENSAAALVNGAILHLLYKHHQERRLLPCPSDVMSLLSSPGMSTDLLFATMKTYPHISKDEFLERNGKKNVLKEIYGEYIEDFRPFALACQEFSVAVKKNEEQAQKYEEALQQGRSDVEPPESNLSLLQRTLRELEEHGAEFDFSPPDFTGAKNKQEIDAAIQVTPPWHFLLVHPKVAEAAANMYNGAEQTRASIMQTAQTSMAVYQDPLVKKNTAVSDFSLRDLLDPSGEVSLYLVLQPNDIDKLRPVLRLFVNTMLAKLVRDMKFDTNEESGKKPKKQRLLLMLDEFPQLGRLESIEKTLAICAGYGVKICIVAQSMGQLNKIYTKDNAIPGNCHVQVYFTPTLEDGGGTAKTLSDTLGERTIHSQSKSTNGKMFEGSVSTSQIARKLMTPDEVRRMPDDRELVFVAGFRPIYGKKIRYYEEKFFTDRVKAPPAFSDTCTKVESYAQLFAVHAADLAQIRKRQQDVKAAKEKAEKCQGHTAENKTIKALQEETESNLAAAEREKPLQEKVRLQKSAAPKERDVKEVEAKAVGTPDTRREDQEGLEEKAAVNLCESRGSLEDAQPEDAQAMSEKVNPYVENYTHFLETIVKPMTQKG